MYLVPYKDQNGRFQFVDIGYFFPWQMPVDFGMDTFHAVRDISAGHTQDALSDMGQAYKSLNLFSNPAISVLSALNTGIDPFTQQPIADKRDPLQKQVLSWMGYGWAQAAPTIATNYGIAGRLIDKYKGEGVNRYGEPQNDWVQIAGRLFGVNTYSVEPDAMRARNLLHMQSNIQQVKGRMSYAVRDKGLTPEQRQRVAKDYVDRIRELTVQMQDYARESQLTPSIRAQLQPRQGMSQ
jgi:hypothetical protein